MKKELNLVKKFHKKFKVPVLKKPCLSCEDRINLRYRLMKDEVKEYLKETRGKNIINIANELTDILYTIYGTILGMVCKIK